MVLEKLAAIVEKQTGLKKRLAKSPNRIDKLLGYVYCWLIY